MKKRPTILFVTYGGGHVNMMVPVLLKLKRRGGPRCVVLGLTTASKVLTQHGIPHRGFRSLLKPTDHAALARGKKMVSMLPANGGVSSEESAAYLGLSYRDLEEQRGVNAAARAYAALGRQAFLPLGPMRRLFDEVRPDLLVTTISPRAEEAAIRVAKERGIPSVCLVDLFGRFPLSKVSQPGYGTRVCVLSEKFKRALINAGRKKEDIFVTGNPAFDVLASPALKRKARAYRRSRGWKDDRIILWASQMEPATNPLSGTKGDPRLPEIIEEKLRGIVQRHERWRLVVRPHPNEPARNRFFTGRIESGEGVPLSVLLAAVDLVVVMTSTVGVEARLLGKPLVSVDLSVFSKDADFEGEGLSRGVRDLAHLERVIEKAFSDPPNGPMGYVKLGSATPAVVRVIESTVRARRVS